MAKKRWNWMRIGLAVVGVAIGIASWRLNAGRAHEAEVQEVIEVFGVDRASAERITEHVASMERLMRDPRLRARPTDQTPGGLDRASQAAARGLSRLSGDDLADWWRVQLAARSATPACCASLWRGTACAQRDLGVGLTALSDEDLRAYFELTATAGLAELDERPLPPTDDDALALATATVRGSLPEGLAGLESGEESPQDDDVCALTRVAVTTALSLEEPQRDAYLRHLALRRGE